MSKVPATVTWLEVPLQVPQLSGISSCFVSLPGSLDSYDTLDLWLIISLSLFLPFERKTKLFGGFT